MIKISLIGNPNVGKTSLFNRLTGSFEHVGNWHGVTVDKKEKTIFYNKTQLTLCDLPGLYSLDASSAEETLASANVLNSDSDLIICVCDVGNLARNLYLALQLIQLNKPVLIAVNMMDELERQGKTFNHKALSQRLNVPVVPISSKRKADCFMLLNKALEFAKSNPKLNLTYPKKTATIGTNYSYSETATMRYAVIDKALAGVICSGSESLSKNRLSLIDKFVLNKYLALPIFLAIMAAIFFVTFGPVGKLLTNALSKGVSVYIYTPVMGWLNNINAPNWVCSAVGEGVIKGMCGILAFLPQLLILFMLLALLEDSGYISRLAFMTDGIFTKVGLSGRSVFTMLVGIGCSASAILTARGLEDEMTRKKTVLLTPFIACSAKLPVFTSIASSFFNFSPIIVFLLYCFGAAFAIFLAALMQKIKPLKSGKLSFVMELPPYRFPTLERVFQLIWHNIKAFLVRVGTVVFALNVIVWILSNFSLAQGFIGTQSGGISLMETIAGYLAILFKPLGFGTWKAVAALLSGIIAKEAVISSMESLGGAITILGADPLSAFCFLVFTLLYVPCVASIAAIAKEAGLKWAMFSILLQSISAYLLTLLVRLICLGFLFHTATVVSALVGIAILGLVFLSVKRLIKNGSKCWACKGECLTCVPKGGA